MDGESEATRSTGAERSGPGADLRAALPGVALLGALALSARLVAGAVPRVSALVVAVALGALVGNATGVPRWARAGVAQHKLLLETGIVLLGASVVLEEVVAAGPRLLALVVGVVAFGLLTVELLARQGAGLRGTTASLLAAGSSICGVSAVAAVGGVVDADSEELTYVAATVLLFDAFTLLVFPVLGELLGLSPREFGVWAGLAMFSTGPVTAAGFAHSAVAGQWATLTKLARNSLIGVVAVGYSLAYARRAVDGGREAGGPGSAGAPSASADPADADRRSVADLAHLWTEFPKFLAGFFLVALVANLGVLGAGALASVGRVSDALFAMAFAGLGVDIRLATMREAGLAPVLVVGAYLVVGGGVALVAVTALL